MRLCRRGVFLLSCVFAVSMTNAVTVNVDDARHYQTIDGLGGFGSLVPWWFDGPYYNDSFLRLLIDTLGITILRTELYPMPDETDVYTRQIPYLRAIKEHADRSGEPLKVIASIWTPPADMKTENSRIGGSLRTDQYEAFADYLVTYVQRFRQDMGYDLYALSPQNEPAITPGYNSCAYWPEELGNLIKLLGPRFKAAGLRTFLHYPDNIWWPDWAGQALEFVSTDRVADSVADILSIHYDTGDETSNRIEMRMCYDIAQGNPLSQGGHVYRKANFDHKNRLWNTEFGGNFNSWNEDLVDEYGERVGGAFTFAKNLFLCLYSGFNAVVYWGISEPPHFDPAYDHYSLMYDGKMGPLAYVAKNFYRYIRPGAVRIGCTSDRADVWCLAFRHEQQGTTTVVLLNTADSEQRVVVQGAGLPDTMQAYQTSPTQNCVFSGKVAAGGAVTLTPTSVTTLYNTPAAPNAAVRATPPGRMSAGTGTPACVYQCDGRRTTAARHTGLHIVTAGNRTAAQVFIRP